LSTGAAECSCSCVAAVGVGVVEILLYVSKQNNSQARLLHQGQQINELGDHCLIDPVLVCAVVVAIRELHWVHHHNSITITSTLSENFIPCACVRNWLEKSPHCSVVCGCTNRESPLNRRVIVERSRIQIDLGGEVSESLIEACSDSVCIEVVEWRHKCLHLNIRSESSTNLGVALRHEILLCGL